MKNQDKKYLLQNVFVFIGLLILVFWWYPNNSWKVLMGDDLIAVTGFRNDGFWGTLINPVNVQLGKVRPVSTIILYIVYKISGLDLSIYYVINRIFLVLTAWLVYYFLNKMQVKMIFSLIVSILLITTPFSSYGVWQMIGICEITSVIGVLGSIFAFYWVIHSEDIKQIRKNVILCTVAFGVVVFNAERFMYLAVIYIFILLFKKDLKMVNKLIYSCIFMVPVVMRTVVITLAGGSGFNTGRTESGDLLTTLVQYTIRGFVNLFGFAIGDQWHGGFDIWQIPNWILIMASCFLFVSLGMLFSALEKWLITQKEEYLFTVFLFAVSLSSLFSYALVGATHGEDRFLWLSYITLCMAITYYLSIYENKNILNGVIIIFSMILLLMNHYYINNKVHAHFRYSQEMAQTCYDNVSELLEGGRKIEYVCCVKPGDYLWVFNNQSFFEFYFDESIEVLYYDSFEMINKDEVSKDTVVVYPDAEYPIPYGVAADWIDECEMIP